jgi:cobalt-zinc-cadmium efflux system outer membrane protein
VRALALLCLLGSPALAAPGPEDTLPPQLSLAEAEEIFLARGLDLLIAEYGAQGAEGDVSAAGAHPNPGLSLSGAYTPGSAGTLLNGGLGPNEPPGALYGLSIGVTDNAAISDQLSGKRSLRIEAASKALAAARLNIEDVKRLELFELREAYVATVMAERNLTAAKDSLATYKEQHRLNQVRYDNGDITALDLYRVEQAELEGEQAVAQAENGVQQAKATLVFLLGVRRGVPVFALTTGIDYGPVEALRGSTVDSLVDQALQHRSDVRMAMATVQQRSAQVTLAKRQVFPDIGLSLTYSEQCSSSVCSSLPAWTLGLSGNLPILYQQQGEIRRAESDAAVARRGLDKTHAQVLSDVVQAYSNYTTAKSQVERMEQRLLKLAKDSRDMAQHMYQKGAVSLIDFLDAQRQYVANQLEYNQDLAGFWTAVYQVEQATGLAIRPAGQGGR